jgi:hypothetical protein
VGDIGGFYLIPSLSFICFFHQLSPTRSEQLLVGAERLVLPEKCFYAFGAYFAAIEWETYFDFFSAILYALRVPSPCVKSLSLKGVVHFCIH